MLLSSPEIVESEKILKLQRSSTKGGWCNGVMEDGTIKTNCLLKMQQKQKNTLFKFLPTSWTPYQEFCKKSAKTPLDFEPVCIRELEANLTENN